MSEHPETVVNEEAAVVPPPTAVTVARIAKQRANVADYRARVEELEAQLKKSELGFKLETMKVGLQLQKEALENIEAAYKAQCVADYLASGEKKYAGGQIKMVKSYEYNEDDAVAWALAHEHANLLKVDARGFKEIAKSDKLRPDFVRVVEEPRAELASDLGEFLEGDNA